MHTTNLLALSLVLFTSTFCLAQADGDAIDTARAKRYADQLQSLEELRVALRDRASSLMANNPNIERELASALQNEMAAAGALRNTPGIVGIPTLLQTYRTYRGQSGELILQPQLLLWYTFQDNTFLRQQLMFSILNAQQNASRSYAALEGSRVALEQIAQNSDENFLKFRQLADFMGRRSSAELNAGEAMTGAWTKADPFHAGATLVRAYALRGAGRGDDCKTLLTTLDNNFPVMESISNAVAAQLAYANDDVKEARRLLDLAVSQARQSGTTEAYVVSGWISMAEQKFDEAKGFAAKARQLQSSPTSKADIEVSLLEALATAYEKPNRGRDALQLLRRAQLSVSDDDWHYHESLALIHLMAKDKQFAKREIDAALKNAPSFIRKELEAEKVAIDAGDLPKIDWKARLKLLWLRQP